MRNKFDAVERQICGRVEQLKARIEREKSDLLKELVTRRTESSKQINHVIAELEQHVSFVESLVMYTEQVREKGTACDVAQQSSTLHSRAFELSKLYDKQRASFGTGSTDVTFTAAVWPSSLSGRVTAASATKSKKVSTLLLLISFSIIIYQL